MAFLSDKWVKYKGNIDINKVTESLESSIDCIRQLADENIKLREELKAANAENAKDERVKEAERKVRVAEANVQDLADTLYYGISDRERLLVTEWWLDHTTEERLAYEKTHSRIRKMPYGPNFHEITYEIIPMAVEGPCKIAKCSCGKTFYITEEYL